MARVAIASGSQDSPAHAGIDPVKCIRVSPVLRFPRTRGDRPWAGKQLLITAAVPPHTRG